MIPSHLFALMFALGIVWLIFAVVRVGREP